jgi:hypothetical protein
VRRSPSFGGDAPQRRRKGREDEAVLLWRLEGGGCPACGAAHTAELSSVAWVLQENYQQAETLRPWSTGASADSIWRCCWRAAIPTSG